MPTQLASAYVQIIPSAKGIGGQISKALGGEAQSAGKDAGQKTGSSFISTMTSVVAAAGLGRMLSNAINIGGELQQNLGGTEAVFQEFADEIQSVAQDAYKNMGMSASDYMATANKMASLFQGSGMDIQTSMDLTTEAMQRAADVASVMGIDTEWAMESIAGAAKGNFTMMDNLGVAMNATTLQAYALEKGINFDWNTASNAEKATLAMEMFMDRTENMAGNFARESADTISGSMGAMKSAFEDFVGNLTLGKDIQGPLKALLEQTKTFLIDNLLPAIGNIIFTLPSVIGQIVTQMGPQMASQGLSMIYQIAKGFRQGFPGMVGNMMTMLDNLVNTIIEWGPRVLSAGMTLIGNLAMGIVEAIPSLVARLPQMITAIGTFLLEQVPTIIQFGKSLLTNLVNGIISQIPFLVDTFFSMLDSLWQLIFSFDWLSAGSQLLDLIGDGISSMISIAGEIFGNFVSNLINRITSVDWLEIGRSIIRGLIDGIKGLFDWALGQVTGFFGGIVDGVKDFLGIHSPSKVFAEFGEMVDRGFAEGVLGYEHIIRKATEDAAALATTSFDQTMVYDFVPRMYDTESDNKKNNTNGGFTQNITINSPKQLDPSETARLTRNQTRQTILALKGV